MTRRAWMRFIALAIVIVVGQVGFTVLDFDPDSVRWALVAVVSATLWWLVVDVIAIDAAPWDQLLPS